MHRRRKQLLSWPFVTLYVATAGAILLHLAAPQLGSAAWFPVAVGVVAAGAIFPLKQLSIKTMTHAMQGRGWRVMLYLFMPALTTVSIFFVDRRNIVLIGSASMMNLIFLAAAIATAFDLPPLRTRRVEGRCPKCYCKLNHWPGKQCPECRWVIAIDAPTQTLRQHTWFLSKPACSR